MRADDGADFEQMHIGLGEFRADFRPRALAIHRIVAVADQALAAVVYAVLHMIAHHADGLLDRVGTAAHLIVGNDAAFVVQAHDGADIQNGGDGGRRAGHAPAAAEVGQIRGEELMMNAPAVLHRPVGGFLNAHALIAQIGHQVYQQAVAAAGAQRIHHHHAVAIDLAIQLTGGVHSVVDRSRHARAESDMQHIAVLELLGKKVNIALGIDLRGLGNRPLTHGLIKLFQHAGVALHIVLALHTVQHVGVKDHGDIALLAVIIRQIYGRTAGKNKFSIHGRSPSVSVMWNTYIVTNYAPKIHCEMPFPPSPMRRKTALLPVECAIRFILYPV